ASITFDGEKKKPANYIIPATFFQALSPAVKKVAQPIVEKVEKTKVEKVEEPKPILEKVVLKSAERRTSSLSLKSIHLKKEVKKSAVEENYDNHPKELFTEKKLQEYWDIYHQKMIAKGENNMATALGVSKPKLKDNFLIELNLPSDLIEGHFKEGRTKFIKYLRSSLNNYGLFIKIIIDKTIEEKKAYGNVGKYKILVQKNPLLEQLRQTFELDL
ncbi:MAG: DNA polymerase III subunit gamma/tau, partial [Polaribacter sp.]